MLPNIISYLREKIKALTAEKKCGILGNLAAEKSEPPQKKS